MQLIAEAYDLLRAGLGGDAGRDRRDLPRLERRATSSRSSSRSPPRCSAHTDAGDRQAVRRRRARPGRAEGHRPLDRAERARPRRPDHRHRRGHVRPLAVRRTPSSARRPARRSAPRPGRSAVSRPRRLRRGRAPRAVRVEDRRLRAGLRPDRAPAAPEYGWDIDRGAMATIWRGGCIIRARFLDRIREAYDARPRAGQRCWSRRTSPTRSRDGLDAWRRVVAPAAAGRRPGAGVLVVAGLLRRAAPRAAARRADPGPARLLRRAHLPARRPRRHLPHRVGRRPEGAPRVDVRPRGRRAGGHPVRRRRGRPGPGCTGGRSGSWTPRAAPGRPTSRARRRPAGRGW